MRFCSADGFFIGCDGGGERFSRRPAHGVVRGRPLLFINTKEQPRPALKHRRVTDLRGPSMKFPPLQKAHHLTQVALRNCFIYGEIPVYHGQMHYLKLLICHMSLSLQSKALGVLVE